MGSSRDSRGEAQSALAAGQAAENRGDWFGATAERSAAVALSLGRPEPAPAARESDPGNDLERLGALHKPSKQHHGYLRHYWHHFRDVRLTARKVVEVGVQTSRSISMWEEFFPNATIYGIDIDPGCTAFAGGRKRIFIGDQMDEKFLTSFIAETGGDFDIVIDDGLHTSYSMLKTFSYLYPALHSRGLYVIEDIMQKPEILGFLHSLMVAINFIPPGFDLRDWRKLSSFGAEVPWLIRNTVGVSFYRYLAFIDRGFNPRDNPFLMSEEAYAAAMADRRAAVRTAMEELRAAGIAPDRDNLIAKLGQRMTVHIDRYFREGGNGL